MKTTFSNKIKLNKKVDRTATEVNYYAKRSKNSKSIINKKRSMIDIEFF